jgi:catechol 2,3-dioxygenase-like lactoylglutathione lyase family enzyme
MLDHFSISVTDYEKSLIFYDQTLGTLGYKRSITIDIPEHDVKVAGYGDGIRPSFWISPMGKDEEEIGRARGVHFAFAAPNEAAVDLWYQKAIELGGKDNGEPGPRAEYHDGYYGAFIIDPDGWRIEACFHGYEGKNRSFA